MQILERLAGGGKRLQIGADEIQRCRGGIVGDQGIVGLPIEAKFGVYTAYIYYKKLLSKLKKTPSAEIKNTRIRVSDYQKFQLFAQLLGKRGFLARLPPK